MIDIIYENIKYNIKYECFEFSLVLKSYLREMRKKQIKNNLDENGRKLFFFVMLFYK